MISCATIGDVGDVAKYHDKAFSQDGIKAADNYYLNEQAAAHWEGRGAELLGLTDKAVTREDFVAFLEGKMPSPIDGVVQDLGAAAARRGGTRRAGWDFTVSPSKSVSIVALVGKDERVVQAHQDANTRAMQWLQDNASVIRVRENGNPPKAEQAGNLLYATVLHETDRSNGPQLHNHNVIAAVVYDEKRQTWRSLTNDVIFALRAQADVVYKAELAKGLRAAGYELEYAKNGVDFEIKGFTREQIEAYSTRTAQIRQALIDKGIDPETASFQARQTATLDSRAAKHEIPREALHAIWKETAQEVGLGLSAIVTRARQDAVIAEATVDKEQAQKALYEKALRAVSWAIEHHSEREQVFKVSDLSTAALKFERTLNIDIVETAIKERMSEAEILGMGLNPAGARMVTTPKARDAEIQLTLNVAEGRGQGNVILTDRQEFDAAVRTFEAKKTQETGSPFILSGEQVNAARNILMHADTYQAIQGEAGTGKTAALAMVKDVAESKGWQVLGMATSASAAKELEQSSGITSKTVAGFFAEREKAMMVANAQIRSLEQTLAKDRAAGKLIGQMVETRTVQAHGNGVEYGKSRYTFDHRQGEVFRSGNGLLGFLGGMLLDSAQSGRDRAMDTKAPPQTLGERLKQKATALQIGVSDFLGQQLSSFERVGAAEAVAARTALSLSGQAQMNARVRTLALKRAELKNLQTTGNRQGVKTLLVMDEASLTGTRDAANISTVAKEIGARVVFQGDTKQHGSVPAGRSFAQAQALGMNTSVLEETRRFDRATDNVKTALREMKNQEFSRAYGALETRVTSESNLAGTVAQRFLENFQELKTRGIEEPSVGVVALTNRDRKTFNVAITDLLFQNGLLGESFRKAHFDDPKLSVAQLHFASVMKGEGVDRLIFRQGYKDIGIRKGDVLEVLRYDTDRNLIIGRTEKGKEVTVNPMRHEAFNAAREETRDFAAGGRVEARAIIAGKSRSEPRIGNGARGVIKEIDAEGATIRWDGGTESRLSNEQLRAVDHSYARTSFKEQGATNHREIIAISSTGAKIFNRQAAYVSATRAKDNTEVITSDPKRVLQNANKLVEKTVAVKNGKLQQIVAVVHGQNKQLNDLYRQEAGKEKVIHLSR